MARTGWENLAEVVTSVGTTYRQQRHQRSESKLDRMMQLEALQRQLMASAELAQAGRDFTRSERILGDLAKNAAEMAKLEKEHGYRKEEMKEGMKWDVEGEKRKRKLEETPTPMEKATIEHLGRLPAAPGGAGAPSGLEKSLEGLRVLVANDTSNALKTLTGIDSYDIFKKEFGYLYLDDISKQQFKQLKSDPGLARDFFLKQYAQYHAAIAGVKPDQYGETLRGWAKPITWPEVEPPSPTLAQRGRQQLEEAHTEAIETGKPTPASQLREKRYGEPETKTRGISAIAGKIGDTFRKTQEARAESPEEEKERFENIKKWLRKRKERKDK